MVPKKLNIGGDRYSVSFVKGLTSEHHGKVWGLCNHNKGTIQISSEIDLDYDKAVTLLHEIFHAIVNHYGLGNVLKDDEERVVDQMSRGTMMVFRDNPKLMDFLKEKMNAD